MKILNAFQNGNGAHCGLSDWYKEGEAQLTAALAERVPFTTGWYSSKKEIASARIWSEDGVKIKVEVSVSDDFDTQGELPQRTKGAAPQRRGHRRGRLVRRQRQVVDRLAPTAKDPTGDKSVDW